MAKNFNLYVPSEYTFLDYFRPRIVDPGLEWFEVDLRRHGVQRKGNNHLVVFLDFRFQGPPSFFTGGSGKAGSFGLRTPAEAELFNRVLGGEREVAVYSLAYHVRMSILAWRLLTQVADDGRVLLEDEPGLLSPGPDFVREHLRLLGSA